MEFLMFSGFAVGVVIACRLSYEAGKEQGWLQGYAQANKTFVKYKEEANAYFAKCQKVIQQLSATKQSNKPSGVLRLVRTQPDIGSK